MTKPVTDHDDQWPRLEIGMESWSAIFGTQGYLNKLYIWYETEAAWEGKAERFRFSIYLWNKWHRGDWIKTNSLLRHWIPYLRSRKFGHQTQLKGARYLETQGADEYPFTEPPAHIVAFSENTRIAYLEQSDFSNMSADELVNELFNRAVEHCEIVSGLPRA